MHLNHRWGQCLVVDFHVHLRLNELLNHHLHLNLSCNHNFNFNSNRILSNFNRSSDYHNHNFNCNHSFNFGHSFDHNSNHNSNRSSNHNSNHNFDFNHIAGHITPLNITLISQDFIIIHLIFPLLSFLTQVAI